MDLDAMRIHYLDFAGAGSPIVGIHGVGSHAWSFAGLARELGDGARVIALDLRGHGDSQWSGDHAYAIADLAADVTGALTSLALGPTPLIGASLGGLVGLQVATASPHLVSRLAVLDIAPSSTKSATDIPGRPEAFDRHADAVAWEQERAPAAAPEDVLALASFGYRPDDGGRLVRKSDPYFLQRWPFRDEDLWSLLPRVTQPTLVARAESGGLSEEDAARMVRELPDARLVTIGPSGHSIQIDNPAALAAALRRFLAPVPA